jgi:glucose-6-phosphate 1-dehydrogenase
MQTTIVIFGATGDLTKRKLIPALLRLHAKGKLENTKIIALGRKDLTDDAIRVQLSEFVSTEEWNDFARRIVYHNLEFHNTAAYETLAKKIEGNRVFYLATAPESFPIIIKNLHKTGAASKHVKDRWDRVVFEKPFGYDQASAKQLNKEIAKLFDEKQIYRIDHYLGKELVQNILVLRFTNPIFEQLWNRKHIDHVQIVVAENIGVGSRGEYYDKSGALRDMVQNHLLQLLSLTAMEMPKKLDADMIRNSKVRVLKSIKKQTPAQLQKSVVLGQYTAGTINGKKIPGYHEEENVAKNSKTETFAALRLEVSNARWRGVPFYLRTGKYMQHAYAEIVVVFKQHGCALFSEKLEDNKLVVRIQPDEGVKVQFNIKDPSSSKPKSYSMDFSHEAEFGMNTAQAYERLLHDVFRGDQTLFTRWDEVDQAWRVVDNIHKAKLPLHPYIVGSHGPAAALKLLTKENRDWYGNKAIRKQ